MGRATADYRPMVRGLTSRISSVMLMFMVILKEVFAAFDM
jgi:hypothetical protein